jgi:hypothetical protein
MFSSTSFAGGYAQVFKVSYEPILQSKDGRIEGCGVILSQLDQGSLGGKGNKFILIT